MTLTRRRFLAISAAALTGTPANAAQNRLTFRALGADCALTLPGPAVDAAAALAAVRSEVARIETAFSLWNPDSELSRLNRAGRLDGPSETFLRGASLAARMAQRTEGAFDVTVQPIWQALAAGRTPGRAPVGWQDIEITDTLIRFRRPGMAATFNGIAQGLAADAAIATLRGCGYRDVLADLGEFASAGRRPDGDPWRIGLAHPVTGEIVARIPLDGATAVATSAPRGTLVRGHPHIFDPLARPGPRWASVTVRASSAAEADALSTAIAAAPMAETPKLLDNATGLRAVLIPGDGPPVHWPG